MLKETSIFLLEPTTSTPFVEFDCREGKLDIIGKNVPRSSPEFYRQIITQVSDHSDLPLRINIALEEPGGYLDPEFQQLLKTLTVHKQLSLTWYYDGYAETDCSILKSQMKALGVSCTLKPF